MEVMQKREIGLDVLKGAAIFLMVFGHTAILGTGCGGVLESLHEFIYTFHMPLFILISGFLFGRRSHKLVECRDVLLRYFLPYLLFGSFNVLFTTFVVMRLGIETQTSTSFAGATSAFVDLFRGANGALWFLYQLGFVQIAAIFGASIFKAKDANRCSIMSLAFPILAFVFVGKSCHLLLNPGFAFHFVFGVFLRRLYDRFPGEGVALGAVVVYLVFAFHKIDAFAVRLVWVLSIMSAVVYFVNRVPESRIVKGLSALGKHTMVILLLHAQVSTLIRIILGRYLIRVDHTGALFWVVSPFLAVGLCLAAEEVMKKFGLGFLIGDLKRKPNK